MLYDINFIIGLLITLMLSTFAYFYFSQKIEEQNEKLNAVSMVVRAMAEEMAYFRNTGQSSLVEKGPLTEKVPLTKEGGETGLAETKVFEIGLANIGRNGSANVGGDGNLEERSNELHLIAVSDDDENSDSSDSDEESDEESGSESGSDDDTELCSVSNEEVEVEDLEMLDGPLISQELTDYKKEENNGDNGNNGNIKSIKLDINMEDLEELGIFEGLGETADKLDVTETKVVEVAGLQPLIEDDQMKSESTDYKKMPLSKLRSIVVEKKLCDDASKMKKPELLELLKPFIGNMD
jgi:hypothetical protein